MHGFALFLLIPALLSAAEPAVTEMSLVTGDGFALKGTLTVPTGPGPSPVVILAHQFRANRTGWKPLTDRLMAAGIATLAVDLRGHGESNQKAGTQVEVTEDFLESAKAVGFDRIPQDLVLAADWVRLQPGIDGRRLALAGSSLGAFSVLLASPIIHPIAVLALSPAGTGAFGANGRQDLVRAVNKARAAVMVMASRSDPDAAANAEALRPIPGLYARVVDGEEHGFAYLPAQSDTMAVFLETYLAPGPRRQARLPKKRR